MAFCGFCGICSEILFGQDWGGTGKTDLPLPFCVWTDWNPVFSGLPRDRDIGERDPPDPVSVVPDGRMRREFFEIVGICSVFAEGIREWELRLGDPFFQPGLAM